ncbi:MAG: glycerol-3-phosphate 1-O-acyltransferase PlsY [Pseudomonadota bacterium]|nr:glycerol-3-phosphate 1-O-acyltransferase PlsY [Pseudomonadota bacterium]
MIVLLADLLVSYLIGSLSGALLLGRLLGKDVRAVGSGNAGATNALRAGGARFAMAVLAVDLLKGLLAVSVVPAIGQTSLVATAWLEVACAAAVVAGHVWPAFYGFRGGKGAATITGTALWILPGAVPWVVGCWILGIALSGYVGVSTVVTAFIAPLYVLQTHPEGLTSPQGVFAAGLALCVLMTHRDNLRRLFRGEEHRFDRSRLWRRRPR